MKNESFFLNVDSEEVAYWLGFLTADGNLHRNGYTLQVNLSRTDKIHLEKLARILGQKVIDTKWTRNGKTSLGCYMAFSSSKCWLSLVDLGFVPDKTHSDQSVIWKNIPDYLKRHFVRGLFDGDGCISRMKNGKMWSISWCGESRIINTIYQYLRDEVGLPATKKENRHLLTVIRWGGRRQIKALEKLLYENATIYLNRKKNLFSLLNAEPSKGRYFGVTRTKAGRWNASIMFNGKRMHLGNFDSPEDAAYAHDKVAIKLNKPAYKINFLETV